MTQAQWTAVDRYITETLVPTDAALEDALTMSAAAGLPPHRFSRPGSLIVIDNVVRSGAVIDADSDDPSVQGVRRLNELLASERRVSATAIQTVGCKGYDGFALALVTGDA